jgi:hypothetical protein
VTSVAHPAGYCVSVSYEGDDTPGDPLDNTDRVARIATGEATRTPTYDPVTGHVTALESTLDADLAFAYDGPLPARVTWTFPNLAAPAGVGFAFDDQLQLGGTSVDDCSPDVDRASVGASPSHPPPRRRCCASPNRRTGRHVIGVGPTCLDAFHRHDWPGNVRELRNLIEGAVVTAPRDLIRFEDLPEHFRERLDQRQAALGERDALLAALATARGDKTKAARILGCSRMTVYRKMKRHGVLSSGRAGV